jgi:2-methylcitrate dehydratase PrpD
MQMGFAARNAVTAVELARRGMPGPRAPVTGEFGYFTLFEGEADPAPFDLLGSVWRIAELSHKPFPTGRATHGGIDAVQRLLKEDGVAADRVVAGRFRVPLLTARLVGRPATGGMSPGYARLCLPYVAAVCLRRGTVGLGDLSAAALSDPQTLGLPRRLTVLADANPDPNALAPQRAEIDLTEGRTLACSVTAVLGSPGHPLSPEAARAKFDACWRTLPDFPPQPAMALWDTIDRLEGLEDVRVLGTMAAP